MPDGGVVVGIDVGGTKSHLRMTDLDGSLLQDAVRPTTAWLHVGWDAKADWLSAWIRTAVADRRVLAVAVGAQGCESRIHCQQLQALLVDRLGAPVLVVNDAELLGPAMGQRDVIGEIAGTGSIAVARHADGTSEYVGGWGWLLGDDGGSSGLVREAIRALLHSYDFGNPDRILERHLLHAAGAADVYRLSDAVTTLSPADWSAWAPAVFTARETGSVVAATVIDSACDYLAALVGTLLGRRVVAGGVVLGGGVFTEQPNFAAAVEAKIHSFAPHLSVAVLRDAPVTGAVALARYLLAVDPQSTEPPVGRAAGDRPPPRLQPEPTASRS